MVSSSSNYVMLTPVLSTVVSLASLSLSSPLEAPRLSHGNSPRRTNPFYEFLPGIDDGDKPERGSSSTWIHPSLSTDLSFTHSDSLSTFSAAPIPSTPVACVQATNLTSTPMLQVFTLLGLPGLLSSSSAELTGISDTGFMFTSSSTREFGTTSALAMAVSSTMEADPPTAPAATQTTDTPSQYTDTSATGAVQSLSIYTTAPLVTPAAQSTTLSSTTTPFLTQIASSSLEGNLDQTTMATSNDSRVSPEVGSIMVGSPVGFTPAWPSPESTSTFIPTTIDATTNDNSGHSAADPTTLKTEARTAAASVTSVEAGPAAASNTSPTEATGNSNHASSSALHGSEKIVAIAVPITVVLLLSLLAVLAWWLLTRRKEKKRVDRLVDKAVWMDPSYIDSIRQKMMGMDEDKVSNDSSNSSPMSKVSAVGRSNTLIKSKRLSVISDSFPALRRSSKRVSRADYLEMARTGSGTKSSEVDDSPDTSLSTITTGNINSRKSHYHDVLGPGANHDDVDHETPITVANNNPTIPPKPSPADPPLDGVTTPGIAADTVEKDMQETIAHRRSDSVVSKVSRHLERAVRRRSGIEELR